MALITPGIPHARFAAKRLMFVRTRSKEAWRTEWSRSVSEAATCLKKMAAYY